VSGSVEEMRELAVGRQWTARFAVM
jgi:hypothetical protein